MPFVPTRVLGQEGAHDAPGRPHPLRESTIEDVKHCFTLITAREQEIHEEAGKSMEMRPRYADEPKKSQVVDFVKPDKKK